MFTQTVTVTENGKQNIIIGRRGTYGTETIVFDLSYLVETYGNGSAVLMVKRSYDTTAYPAVTEQVDNQLSWVVTDTDTSYKGHGECELFWYVDDTLAKSVIYGITVLRDIGETTENPPDPYQTWVDDLTELGAETLENAQAAAQSATDAAAAKVAAETAQGKAETAQTSAETNALKSEGYAVGTQNGTPVSSGSPYYENNAEYMKDAAAQYALAADASEGEAAAWATGSYSGNPSGLPVPSTAPQYHNNAYYYAQQASGSATTASNAKTDAENAQTAAETAQGLAEIAQGKAEDAQEAIENMTVSSTTLSAGSDATVTKTIDEETGLVNLAFGIPEGEQGESGADGADGFSPAVTITDITGGHTVTITDKTHPTGQSFNVMDGQDGASDAGEVTYDETATYNDGTVGKALNQLNSAISTKADVIVDSVGPAAIASFPDGANGMAIRELNVSIEPVQDLHGYDNPWPSGGGANKLVAGTWATGQYTDGAWGIDLKRRTSEYCPISPNVQYTMSIDPNENKDLAWINYNYFDADKQWLGNRSINGDASFNGQRTHTFTITNSSARYIRLTVRAHSNTDKNISTDDIDAALPQLNEGASVITPWTPYENICPISGFTQANGTATGKNLFNKSLSLVEGHLLNANGEDVEHASYSYTPYYIAVNPDTKYSFSGKTNNTGTYNSVCYYDKNKNFISSFLPSGSGDPAVFITPNNCYFIRANFANEMNRDVDTIQLEQGNATSYEAYSATPLTVNFSAAVGTVYGGEAEIISGQDKKTLGCVEDMSQLSWSVGSGENRYVAAIDGMKVLPTARSMNLRCSIYKPNIGGGAYDDFTIYNGANSANIYVVDSSVADATELATKLSGQQLVYELATPVPFTTDPVAVNTKYGQNNIFFDCGNTSAKYPCDTKLYIDKIAANIVAALS